MMERCTNGPMRNALKQESRQWGPYVKALCDDIDVLQDEVQRLQAEIKRLEAEIMRLRGELHGAVEDTPDLDSGPCMECGGLAICAPEGLALCHTCAKKMCNIKQKEHDE